MTKCSNCKSVELVTIGALVLLGTELFCDAIQCASCFYVFAVVPRQIVLDIKDEREPDDFDLADGEDEKWFFAKEQFKASVRGLND